MKQPIAASATWRVPRVISLLLALGLPAEELRAGGKQAHTNQMTVTATAYSSSHAQTDATPFHGAWGDRLDQLPAGKRAIAVSADLVAKGLERGTVVRIKGESDTFVVLDRAPARWTRRIDVYMGTDVQAAKDWGRRKVQISWKNGMVASLDGLTDEARRMRDKPQRD